VSPLRQAKARALAAPAQSNKATNIKNRNRPLRRCPRRIATGSPPNSSRHRWRSSDRESRSKSPRSQSDRRRFGIGHSCCPMHAHIHPKRQSATAARRSIPMLAPRLGLDPL
jgi:hypothetical protein